MSGISYVLGKGQSLYSGFTSTGDRSKDLFNHQVQSEAYTKGINNVVQGQGVNVADVKGTVTVDTTNISIKPIELAPGTVIPMELAPGTVIPVKLADGTTLPVELAPGTELPIGLAPGTEIGLNVGTKTIPVDVTGKAIPIAAGSEVALKVADITKVKLDIPDDVALPVEGLDENFKAVYANKAGNLGKSDIILGHKIEAHNIEYVSDGGIRSKEGKVADWKDLEYKTPVLENGTEVNKINRDIKAWQGMHSSNPDTSYSGESDTAGNEMNLPKGLIGALAGAGILEYFREGAMSKALLNVKAQAQADQIEKRSNDTDIDNDDDINNLVRGFKKVVYPSDSEYVSQGEGFGSGLKDLQVHSSKMEVK